MFRRRTMLTLTVVGLVPAFVAVNGLVALARGRRQQLERDWAARGAQDLGAGRPADAADDFRAAQSYARDHARYRLDLARALAAAGRLAEARSELDTEWFSHPGDGVINVELARIAAREGDVTSAVRYYHGAIDGAWSTRPADARREARLELATLLVNHQQIAQAQAELTILLADPPVDPRAEALAGRVAFVQGDYRTAATRLRAAAPSALDADTASMLDVSTRALALDPDARGISSRERVRRVIRLFDIARRAAAACGADAAAGMRDRLDASADSVTERTLARDPDAVDATIALLTAANGVVAAACPPADPDARALGLLLQHMHS